MGQFEERRLITGGIVFRTITDYRVVLGILIVLDMIYHFVLVQ